MKSLIITDIHIIERWFEEVDDIFSEVISYKADNLIIAGDYFHRHSPTLKE